MPPPKGKTNNPAGKPVGTKNRISREIRPLLKELLEGELLKIPKLMAQLEPKDRVQAILKMMEFILPKANGQVEKEELKPVDQESSYRKIVMESIMKVKEDAQWQLDQEQKELRQSKSLPPSSLNT